MTSPKGRSEAAASLLTRVKNWRQKNRPNLSNVSRKPPFYLQQGIVLTLTYMLVFIPPYLYLSFLILFHLLSHSLLSPFSFPSPSLPLIMSFAPKRCDHWFLSVWASFFDISAWQISFISDFLGFLTREISGFYEN